jgi:hypothetical protein
MVVLKAKRLNAWYQYNLKKSCSFEVLPSTRTQEEMKHQAKEEPSDFSGSIIGTYSFLSSKFRKKIW